MGIDIVMWVLRNLGNKSRTNHKPTRNVKKYWQQKLSARMECECRRHWDKTMEASAEQLHRMGSHQEPTPSWIPAARLNPMIANWTEWCSKTENMSRGIPFDHFFIICFVASHPRIWPRRDRSIVDIRGNYARIWQMGCECGLWGAVRKFQFCPRHGSPSRSESTEQQANTHGVWSSCRRRARFSGGETSA